MNEFRPDNHRISEEDLIAFSLGELPPDRSAAIRLQLLENPALTAEAEGLSAMHAMLKVDPMPIDRSVLNRNWQALRPTLAPYPVPIAKMPRWQPQIVPGLVIAGLAVTAGLWLHGHSTHNRGHIPAQITAPPPATDRQIVAPAATPAVPLSTAVPASQGQLEPLNLLAEAGPRAGLSKGASQPKWKPADTPRPVPGSVLARAENGPPAPAAPQKAAARETSAETSGAVPPTAPGDSGVQPEVAGTTRSPQPVPSTGTGAAKASAVSGGTPGRRGHGGGGGTRRTTQVETTVALGVGAHFDVEQKTTMGQVPGTQSLGPSNVFLGSFRQSFKPLLGYTVNLGASGGLEQNKGATRSIVIPVNMYEVSAAYTAQKRVKPKVAVSAELGGGVLFFKPTGDSSTLTPSPLPRALGVGGLGVEYQVSPHFGVRGEYRALVYKLPDFGDLVGRAVTVTSEPTVSVTYRFGGRK